ncbi:TPA: glycogen synthase GlgA [bacterium]|nr:glycogen synthase GlgA [bacterium]
MEIVIVTPEMVPFAKTGGLADVCGALPKELAKLKNKVYTFMPKYKAVQVKTEKELELIVENEEVFIEKVESDGVIYYFVACPKYFDRDFLYGTKDGDYPDNDRRFILFNRAVLLAIKEFKIKPDIIHCHDWQAGLISGYIKRVFKDPFYDGIKTVFTIHNIGYQGLFSKDAMLLAGFSEDEWHYERLEYWGKFSFLKAGLVYSDIITTVSPTYSEEIKTEEFGYGLEGVLRAKSNSLFGIINGIDYTYWQPENDKAIPYNYDEKTLDNKIKNKLYLQKEMGIAEDENIFLIGMVTRLSDQKGLDITADSIDEIVNLGIQFVVLGTGEDKYHKIFGELAEKYKGKIGVNIKFDDSLARRIYASCDSFLIPSRYEPCGLTQMVALKYGTIPIVRKTGGLADTIRDSENGFVFFDYTKDALVSCIKKAGDCFMDKKIWNHMVKKGMKEDFGWARSAEEYLRIYKIAIHKD